MTRKHHRRATNAIQLAINGARKLNAADVAGMEVLTARALDEFMRGIDCARAWLQLVDVANMAETLAAMRIGSGDDADAVIDLAQTTLCDVQIRHATRGTWTLRAAEIDSLHWLARLHAIQLRAVSMREFATAFDRTRDRIAQAVAGNAAPGVTVLEGSLA